MTLLPGIHDVDDPQECAGGCGDLFTPNAIGIASCGENDCARRAWLYEQADMQGSRI